VRPFAAVPVGDINVQRFVKDTFNVQLTACYTDSVIGYLTRQS